MKRCTSSQKVGVFFPHLMTALCKKVGVRDSYTSFILEVDTSSTRSW
ncbi:hypothetical protein Gotur_026802 [Gossypium turneri]